MSESRLLLDVVGVTKKFGGVTAVNNVSMQVRDGMIKSVIGPNGAGKTTFFNLISGVIHPDTGSIRLKDKPIETNKAHTIAKMGISRTFQTMQLFSNMTVLENIMLGRHTRTRVGMFRAALRTLGARREERQIRQDGMKWLEFIGLEEFADRPSTSLPCGQQKRLEIGRALATDPKLLLLDEPAAGLNMSETEELGQLLIRIKELGVTQILVEHDMSLVMDVSDEIVVLNYGSKVTEGSPEEVQNNQEVVAVYLGTEG